MPLGIWSKLLTHGLRTCTHIGYIHIPAIKQDLYCIYSVTLVQPTVCEDWYLTRLF